MKKPIYKKWWFWVIIFVVCGVIGSNTGDKKDEAKNSSAQAKQETKKEETKKDVKEETKKEQKKVDNTETKKTDSDKVIYETEIKPKIEAMIKEYDDIWNEDWKPIWNEASNNPESVNKNDLKNKMELVTNKYDALSKKNIEFKDGEKLSNSSLKEKVEKFRVEFGLATNYRSNAGRSVTQGIEGVAPMKDRMEEAKKSIQLSDKKIINASINIVEIEKILDIKHN